MYRRFLSFSARFIWFMITFYSTDNFLSASSTSFFAKASLFLFIRDIYLMSVSVRHTSDLGEVGAKLAIDFETNPLRRLLNERGGFGVIND
jgi:hypothetical protein